MAKYQPGLVESRTFQVGLTNKQTGRYVANVPEGDISTSLLSTQSRQKNGRRGCSPLVYVNALAECCFRLDDG
jgi:hypothetical protein